MPFKRPRPGKELAFRFRLPSCHNQRPFPPSDPLTAPGGRLALGTVSRPHPPPRRLLIGRCAKAWLRGIVTASFYWPQSTSLYRAHCFPGQPSVKLQWWGGSSPSESVIGVLGVRRTASPSADWPELRQSKRRDVPPVSSWPPAGNAFSRIFSRGASGLFCWFQRSETSEKAILFTNQESPRPDLVS